MVVQLSPGHRHTVPQPFRHPSPSTMPRASAYYVLVVLAVSAAVAAAVWFYPVPSTIHPDPSPSAGAPSTAVPVRPTGPDPEPDVELPPGIRVSFVDVTDKAGIRFQHFDGRT